MGLAGRADTSKGDLRVHVRCLFAALKSFRTPFLARPYALNFRGDPQGLPRDVRPSPGKELSPQGSGPRASGLDTILESSPPIIEWRRGHTRYPQICTQPFSRWRARKRPPAPQNDAQKDFDGIHAALQQCRQQRSGSSGARPGRRTACNPKRKRRGPLAICRQRRLHQRPLHLRRGGRGARAVAGLRRGRRRSRPQRAAARAGLDVPGAARRRGLQQTPLSAGPRARLQPDPLGHARAHGARPAAALLGAA
jgi:hypothetical protein